MDSDNSARGLRRFLLGASHRDSRAYGNRGMAMSARGFMDGDFGPLTLEAKHLFGKSESYIDGYHQGRKWPVSIMRDSAAQRAAERRGGQFWHGFMTGRAVRRQGAHAILGGRTPRRSYRDPDLSDQWLSEAEWRAVRESSRFGSGDARKIILRLVREVRRLNRMLER